MRYYIYLDKTLLQTLFSAVENIDFNIDVVECSVRKNYGSSNEVSLEPGIENILDFEKGMEKEIEQNAHKREKNGNARKEKFGISYEHNNSYNVQTEKKYINIEDVSNMKNNAFYHRLVKIITREVEKENSRIILESGIITKINNNVIGSESDAFFLLNNNYIWFDKNKINIDFDLLSTMNCKVTVVGYMINCEKRENEKNILKAITVFME